MTPFCHHTAHVARAEEVEDLILGSTIDAVVLITVYSLSHSVNM